MMEKLQNTKEQDLKYLRGNFIDLSQLYKTRSTRHLKKAA